MGQFYARKTPARQVPHGSQRPTWTHPALPLLLPGNLNTPDSSTPCSTVTCSCSTQPCRHTLGERKNVPVGTRLSVEEKGEELEGGEEGGKEGGRSKGLSDVSHTGPLEGLNWKTEGWRPGAFTLFSTAVSLAALQAGQFRREHE